MWHRSKASCRRGSPPARAIRKAECAPSTADGHRAFRRLFQGGDIDLLHLQQRLHHAAGASRIFVAHQLAQSGRNDLPGETESVLEPPTLTLAAAVRGELAPVLIDFL